MKVSDILETSLIKRSNQLDRGERKETNGEVARRIASGAKDRSKKANPGVEDTVVQASAGGHGSAFLNR